MCFHGWFSSFLKGHFLKKTGTVRTEGAETYGTRYPGT